MAIHFSLSFVAAINVVVVVVVVDVVVVVVVISKPVSKVIHHLCAMSSSAPFSVNLSCCY